MTRFSPPLERSDLWRSLWTCPWISHEFSTPRAERECVRGEQNGFPQAVHTSCMDVISLEEKNLRSIQSRFSTNPHPFLLLSFSDLNTDTIHSSVEKTEMNALRVEAR